MKRLRLCNRKDKITIRLEHLITSHKITYNITERLCKTIFCKDTVEEIRDSMLIWLTSQVYRAARDNKLDDEGCVHIQLPRVLPRELQDTVRDLLMRETGTVRTRIRQEKYGLPPVTLKTIFMEIGYGR